MRLGCKAEVEQAVRSILDFAEKAAFQANRPRPEAVPKAA